MPCKSGPMRVRELVVAAMLLVTGCSGGDEPPPAVRSVTTFDPVAIDPRTVDPVKRDAFLDAVASVKPELLGGPLRGKDVGLGDRQRILQAGLFTCGDLALERGGEQPLTWVVANAVQRFSTATRPVTAEEAESLVAAAEQHLC